MDVAGADGIQLPSGVVAASDMKVETRPDFLGDFVEECAESWFGRDPCPGRRHPAGHREVHQIFGELWLCGKRVRSQSVPP